MKRFLRPGVVPFSAGAAALALLLNMAGGCSSSGSNIETTPQVRASAASKQAPPPLKVKTGATNTNTNASASANASATTNVVRAPTSAAVGRVFSVNAPLKFAVITFPVGQLPPNDARFSVFHAGTKVAEIKITIPPAPIGNGVTADIIAGSAAEGDEVRAE